MHLEALLYLHEEAWSWPTTNCVPKFCVAESPGYCKCCALIPAPCVVSQTPSPYTSSQSANCSSHLIPTATPAQTLQVRDSTHKNTYIPRLTHPRLRHALTAERRQAIDILGGAAALVIDVARQAGLVRRVANQEHALDGVEGRAGQFGECVDGRRCALRVAFEDDAFGGGSGDEGLDFVDDLLFEGIVLVGGLKEGG